jgi:hypothetical protein
MKNYLLSLLILLGSFAAYSSPDTLRESKQVHVVQANSHELSANSLADCIIETSYSLVGVVEVTTNSSPEIDKMLKLVGFAPGAAWCGADVAYTYAQCIPVADLETFLPMTKWAYTPYTYNRAKELNAIVYQSGSYTSNTRPKPTDAFWIWSSRLNRVAHIGIIDNWHPYGRMAITLEGNTNNSGSREGDGHYVMYRDKRQIYAVGDIIGTLNRSTAFSHRTSSKNRSSFRELKDKEDPHLA